jgi:RecA/RadA recombinase
MSGLKLMSKLRKLDGAVATDHDPLLNCLRTPSPSVNWALGLRGFGLPYGYSMILFGPPKSGKSIICNAMIGQLHNDDPEAVAVAFNTELRGELQNSDASLRKFKIDPDRFQCYDVNEPALIFDRIENDIAALCQEGLKIKLIVIDSLKGIAGRRALNADSVNKQQIGDQAATLQDGFMRILPIIRKYKIALVMTTHVRAELDQAEQMRGNDTKMAAAWAVKHMAELFCYVEPNRSKAGRTTLAGEDFLDPETTDFMDKAQKTGHKIRLKVTGNSIGPDGRTAEFTLDYSKGIINQYEEVFTLAKNMGVIEKPSNVTYKFGDMSWHGLKACLMAIRDDHTLYDKILAAVYIKDSEKLA